MESTRAASLRSQRDEALGALRKRFGSDAVERAAFAFFSSAHKTGAGRGGGAEWGGRTARGEVPLDDAGDNDPVDGMIGSFGSYDDGESPKIPVSMIAKALRPAYGPDCDYHTCDGGGGEGGDAEALLTAEAVAEAVASECGTDSSSVTREGDRRGLRLTFEQFLAVAARLTRRKVDRHANRCD